MLTNYNGTAINYDAIGNPLNWRNAFMLEWYGRNLITFAKPTGEMYAYTYNADGIRTSKNYYNAGGNLIGTDEYIYDGTKLIAENRSGTWLYYFYDANGAVTGMSYGGTLYYFRKNLQGDVTGIYNASGNIIVQYEYTPYGALLAVTDANGNDISTNASHIANINPFRYRGYYYDIETELYYLITRYYDPEVGRFLNADAIIGANGGIEGYNSFAYCNNNPIMYMDSLGLLLEGVLEKYAWTLLPFIGADGPLPIVDIIVVVVVVVVVIVSIDDSVSSSDSYSYSPSVEVAPYPGSMAPVAQPEKAISISKTQDLAITKEKEETVKLEPISITYYHSTTLNNALSIMASGKMTGSPWEGGYVFAWVRCPSKKAVEVSGAKEGVIISFETVFPFERDPGIDDKTALKYIPVRSCFPGPIYVTNVQIVEGSG